MKSSFFALLLVCAAAPVAVQGEQVGNGTIRLFSNKTGPGVASGATNAGIIQIYIDDQWGNICSNQTTFGQREADTVCYQLGYNGADSFGAYGAALFGVDTSAAVIKDVHCDSDQYQVLSQCQYSPADSNSCNDKTDVHVTCSTTDIWGDPYDGMVRLVEGSYSSEGLVEVYCNKEWGTVCDDGIDDDEADTVCVQLGYTKSFKWDKLPIRGNGSQPIWLDNLYCGHTDKTCIGYCQTCPSKESTDCSHGEDLTVQCTYNKASFEKGSLRTTCTGIEDSWWTFIHIVIIAAAGLVGFILCCLCVCLSFCCCCAAGAKKKKKVINTAYTQFD
ncbi:PREDICTED: neurotrypsin-like isoform X3 [Amphimedon queenslandica]|uniref:SRCR domain-containing protein n=1 Tax=Amphimedon queenslandica TaxID=400682 RepID=A0AAN0JF35_AMPQE|nr:PREDICTED: neurotrypsin-like isoform X3 [Amphimedon queenslandica]|eukprot:XP_019855396.1 PREDICTED: neurotrypsin-like isoform X3 [Amphimedon queenslandica]